MGKTENEDMLNLKARLGLRYAANKLAELVFPPRLYCACCGNIIDDTRTYSLCDHCMEHFRWDTGSGINRGGLRLIRCVSYGIYERSLIFDLKYKGKKHVARVIAEIMADKLLSLNLEIDYLVPVPMFKAKEKQRGFNQAKLIADFLSKELTCEVADYLVRTRQTRPMRGLSEEQRAENIKGSIVISSDFDGFSKGTKVAVIDDFYTTGSTARECLSALEGSGAEEIIFLAFASR